MPSIFERRNERSNEIFKALGLQLRACKEDADLHAIVISDDDGLCLASAGPEETCGEVAAVLPLLGQKAGDFQGILLGLAGGARAMVHRFSVDASNLYVCVLGGDGEMHERQIARSISGCARILSVA